MKLRNLFTALQLESRHGAVTYRGSFAVEGCQYAESGLAPLPIQRSAIRVIEHSVYADHVEKRVIKWQRFVDIIGSDHCIGNHIGLPFIHNPPGSAAASCSGLRSEEHTSELQSLMRISYAVFCLKKKKRNHLTHNSTL